MKSLISDFKFDVNNLKKKKLFFNIIEKKTK